LIHLVRVEDDPEAAWLRARQGILSLSLRISSKVWTPEPQAIPEIPDDIWDGWKATPGETQYLEAVAKAREYILAGDIFQVVLSRRWRRMAGCRAEEIYRMLRLTNPSPYMFFLDTGSARIFGSSPEMLVQLRGEQLSTCPIAGTRPRGSDLQEDLRMEEELKADPKERAEHVMLVDLGRNDLGRVCVPGSIRLLREMVIERYSHVMHLVSELKGRLREGLDAWDALFSCFPAGTLSGAPKIRAMEIIEELEEVRRGVYGGAVGYLNADGDLDFCIAIRTGVEVGGILHLQAGAGIVYDSQPERELAECRAKASALARAVAMAERASADGGVA
jgi:anthranilate synthase component 1